MSTELCGRYCVQCHRGDREVKLLHNPVCVDCRDKNVAWFRQWCAEREESK